MSGPCAFLYPMNRTRTVPIQPTKSSVSEFLISATLGGVGQADGVSVAYYIFTGMGSDRSVRPGSLKLARSRKPSRWPPAPSPASKSSRAQNEDCLHNRLTSPPRKRGSRACPGHEQGATAAVSAPWIPAFAGMTIVSLLGLQCPCQPCSPCKRLARRSPLAKDGRAPISHRMVISIMKWDLMRNTQDTAGHRWRHVTRRAVARRSPNLRACRARR